MKIIRVAPHNDSLFIPPEFLREANDSLELQCLLQTHTLDPSHEDPVGGCPAFFDSVLCWPRTPPASLAILPCFKEFKGVQYDSTQNATRYCHLDGKWDNYTNYDQCHHLLDNPTVPEFEPVVELPTYIYCTGYLLSLIALALAIIVFIHFKDLRCLRNTIHINLFLTYILSALLWLMTLGLMQIQKPGALGCIFLVTFLNYFSLTNFFWMLVEGLYLYMLVVETFSGENLRFYTYVLIGWGGPAVFVTAWAIARGLSPPVDPEHLTGLQVECPWMHESHMDWLYQGPACAVLVINLIFLIRIMWVLITKLRSANTVETRQYRKASKALLVLIPLLGITYLVILTGPAEGMSSHIFAIARALLISTQGFCVSLFYCFLNSEVRLALRHRFDRWRDERNIRSGQSLRNRRYTLSKDYSPRSRTESIRLANSSSPSN